MEIKYLYKMKKLLLLLAFSVFSIGIYAQNSLWTYVNITSPEANDTLLIWDNDSTKTITLETLWGNIETDVITEASSGVGVTVDGLLLKDGDVGEVATTSGYFQYVYLGGNSSSANSSLYTDVTNNLNLNPGTGGEIYFGADVLNAGSYTIGRSTNFFDGVYTDTIFLTDGTTWMTRDASNNLELYDAIAGTSYTLTELAAGGGAADSSWTSITIDTIYELRTDEGIVMEGMGFRNSVISFEDSNVEVWRAAGNNLSFRDPNAGVKTLTELAAGGGAADSSWTSIQVDTINSLSIVNLDGSVLFDGTGLLDNFRIDMTNVSGSTRHEQDAIKHQLTGYTDVGQSTASGFGRLYVDGNDAQLMFVDGSSNIMRLALSPSSAIFRDMVNSKGLEYYADYSANSTARSLIDKAEIEALIAAGGGSASDSSSVTYSTDSIKTLNGTSIMIDEIEIGNSIIIPTGAGQTAVGTAVAPFDFMTADYYYLEDGTDTYIWEQSGDILFTSPDVGSVALKDLVNPSSSDSIYANYLVNFDPVASVGEIEGNVYYDSDDNYLKLWDGTAWDTLNTAGGGGSGDMTKAVYDTDDDGAVDEVEGFTPAGGSVTLAGADAVTFQTPGTVTVDIEATTTDTLAFKAYVRSYIAGLISAGETGLTAANNLSDVASAATSRTNLGVDVAGTDNSTDVTLAGSYDYLTLSTQEITMGQIDLTTDVTGVLPDANVANDITITNISQVADITASAAEINTPLDGASVTLTEFRELETIGDNTISADQWAGLGGASTFGISLWDDADAAAVRTTLAAAPLASPAFTGTVTAAAITATGAIIGESSITLHTDATVTLTAVQCRNGYHYNNDAGVIDFDLPTAEAGLTVLIGANATGVITIDAAAGDIIVLDGTALDAADAIDSPGARGDFIVLQALDATTWMMLGRSGTWVDGGTD